ncbi:sigma-70 family RNA polymerase sigma factor [Antarcticibacterium arcticum]|uniref:Sigma-70 family RNA polymerase sigma factor n=1 Tax=Antarcticibacterium arcticum TaxID=2585771 RepID=A0A5B8YJM1_9FLAO|nr:sigma-70 family RNA polymerase sigma factor [Antarcticibacterium arcticum]QED37831.1 sigma-70 family RNA polymerase sigma factor [Antarcticibacterium arcticum]
METSEIWNKYSEELRGYLLKKTGDIVLAEDMLHETFIKVHLNISQLRSEEQLKYWVYRIADNTLTDHFRRKPLSETVPASEENEETPTHTAGDCLLPLIKKLPKKYREAVLLSDIQGLKQNKVAEILGMSLSGAKSRIQRGRKLIQQGFVNCCDYTINEQGFLVGDDKTEDECKVCS